MIFLVTISVVCSGELVGWRGKKVRLCGLTDKFLAPVPETAAEDDESDASRGAVNKSADESVRAPAAPAAPSLPAMPGLEGNNLYMGMFQMMAMPMKAPGGPNLPSLPGAGGGS